MRNFNPEARTELNVLATDLDGTLIPLPGNDQNRKDLEKLRKARQEHPFTFVYATGRHFESGSQAVKENDLPVPDWIVCDVGTSIYHKQNGGFERFRPYRDHLEEITGGYARDRIETLLTEVDGLTLQKAENQQEFKISYECASDDTEALGREISRKLEQADIPYHATTSIDPFLDSGLIDLLPEGTSKAYALTWLSTHAGFHPDSVIFAGDSGNDVAALISGFHAIVVANAPEAVADTVRADLREKKLESHLYCASAEATSGVLEGCIHFGLLPESFR